MAKSVLFVFDQPPYGSSRGQETLDALLASASFELPLAALFIGDGVWHLLPEQDGTQVGRKKYVDNFKVLPLFDVNDLFVCEQSLQERGLCGQPLVVDTQPVTAADLPGLVDRYHYLLRF